ncbi:MAG: GNAT family N-acetyltransferase [Rhodospirillales bacterium]|nr:GNAT family N-acetyltransferase [Rhodospirillales bacterium]
MPDPLDGKAFAAPKPARLHLGGVTIRLARDDADTEAMIELGRLLHAESRFRHLPYDEARLRELGKLGLAKGNPGLLMAERGSKIVGMAVVMLGEHYFSKALAATVQLIYVTPEARGGAAAVNLLRAIRRWSAQNKAVDLHINVTTGIDATRTDRFLRHMGFKQTGGNYVLEGVGG